MTAAPSLTVQSTENWAWTREYNIQLCPETHKQYFSDVLHGEFLMTEAEHSGVTFSTFGKLDIKETDHLNPGEVGIGLNMRSALGVSSEESVQVSNESPPGYRTQYLDEIIGKRPVICRVRKSVHPDIGFNICRMSKDTFDILGIVPGDRVIIESTNETTTLKALPLRSGVANRKKRQTAQNPERYPDPVDLLDLDDITGTDIDIPEIHLDAERRTDLNLAKQTEAENIIPLSSGICQPVKVTRDATSVYLRSLNEVTVPVIVGLLATIFVFDPWLSTAGEVAIIGVGILFVLLSVLYRVRRTSLV